MMDHLLDLLTPKESHSASGSKPLSGPLIASSDFYEIAKPTERLIRQYPAAALATAFLAGVVIAWWIKRK